MTRPKTAPRRRRTGWCLALAAAAVAGGCAAPATQSEAPPSQARQQAQAPQQQQQPAQAPQARQPQPAQALSQAPGWYRMKLGSFVVTALYDGYIDLDSAILKGAPADEIERLLARSFQKSPNTTSVNAYLIDAGSRRVLVDAGSHDLFGPTLGRLHANLRAAGYAPEQVDAVLITHLHPDHVGGVTADGKMAFPNATVHVDRRESEFWLGAANLAAAPQDAKAFFRGAQASAAPYVAAGRWKTYDGDAELVPGIRPLSYGRTPGHTPGHEGYMVESGGQKMLVWGDVVHSAAVQFPRPEVTIAFDADPKEARATRLRLLDLAVRERLLVAAAHISFPGLGHVRKEGAAYAWVPLEYGPPR